MPKLLNQDQDEIFLPPKARDQDFQASLAFLWSQCQGKKFTSHSFLGYLQTEILTNIFGAFTNAHPVFP